MSQEKKEYGTNVYSILGVLSAAAVKKTTEPQRRNAKKSNII